jgi:hypothetical protein
MILIEFYRQGGIVEKLMKTSFNLLLILLFLISNVARAEKRLYLGAGTAAYNMGKVTSSSDASTSMLGELYLPLTLSYVFPVQPTWSLEASVSTTPLAVKTTDSISKKFVMGSLTQVFKRSLFWDLKSGVGLLSYSITGIGGSIQRSNGTGTATFYYPGSSTSSKNLFLDFGAVYHWIHDIRIEVDAMILSPISARRSFSTFLTISKGIL